MKIMKQIVAAVERNGKTYWTRIGVAFENRDGSWALKFDFVPTSATTGIQLRDIRQAEAPTVTDESTAEPEAQTAVAAMPF